jgi:hypothetical protein
MEAQPPHYTLILFTSCKQPVKARLKKQRLCKLTCIRGKAFSITKFQENLPLQNAFKYRNAVLPVTIPDRLLKDWVPRVLCSTEIGIPTIPELPRNGDVFALVGL